MAAAVFADGGGNPLRGGEIDVGDRHACALGGEIARYPLTDAAAAAGDDDRLSLN